MLYHMFRCGIDGTGLVQLTDGPGTTLIRAFCRTDEWRSFPNDAADSCVAAAIVPCMPCIPWPDGSDIIRLSFHETHEWQPSITNDGMLVYTRWDYVDRDTNIAHHIWTSYPDGRDPRSFHGNYPEQRESRPWMEMSIRAIPNSQKFVASTGAHHGHAFGSLVLIDPQREDDWHVATEETYAGRSLPGGGGVTHRQVHGVRDAVAAERRRLPVRVRSGGAQPRHLLDRPVWQQGADLSGSADRLHRSDTGPSPAEPAGYTGSDGTNACGPATVADPDPPATVSLLNVYDSDFAWPTGTRIARCA